MPWNTSIKKTLSSKFSSTILQTTISTLSSGHFLLLEDILQLEFQGLSLVVFFLRTVTMWELLLSHSISYPRFLRELESAILQCGTRTYIAPDSQKR
uniref:Uncharacterized protein n=1 Tax=Brassica oleracea TaxID=3712 RepID=A0A3P6GEP8_BRAOL|nr:unnamed protein product [Brassica oleracea]